MAAHRKISPEILSDLLDYRPETGQLFWRPRAVKYFKRPALMSSWNKRFAFKPAFTSTSNHGYKQGAILEVRMLAHKAIWAIVHRKWPEKQIDHINGNRSDNRLINLREVTKQQNMQNAALPNTNTTGIIGVYQYSQNIWVAKIKVNKKSIHLGTFRTKEDAAIARSLAEQKYGFHPNHGRNPQ